MARGAMKRRLIVGSRGSALALRQTQIVVEELKRRVPGLECAVRVIKTTGDKMLVAPFTQMVGRGFFTKEIEEALQAGEIDFAVHSLKDLPTEMPERLVLAAVTKREDPRDALVAQGRRKLADLPRGARVGTSSPRRKMQLLAARPDLDVVTLRGNLSTRVGKVLDPAQNGSAEKLDAAVLAVAGIRRMGLEKEIAEILPFEVMLPAVGQGFLGIEARAGDDKTMQAVSLLDDPGSRLAATAERAFLAAWGGGCSVPLGALAQINSDELRLRGVVYKEAAQRCFRDEVKGKKEDAEKLGKLLAERIKQQ